MAKPEQTLEAKIEGLQSILDETKKSDSLKKLEAAIARLTPDETDATEGLEDVADAIKEYKDIKKKGLKHEEYK